MKKSISLFSIFFLYTCHAFAVTSTTTLTTYYPPPTAAYNQVKLATNYTAPITTVAYCTGGNNGNIYLDSSGTLNQCTGAAASTPYCAANTGAVIADAKGTLHVCMNGTDTIYPQECYNAFCSYTSPATSCATASSCANGFTHEPVDLAGDMSDTFQSSSTPTYITSIVCCSGTPAPAPVLLPNGAACPLGASSCASGYCEQLTNPPQCTAGAIGNDCTTGNDCQSTFCDIPDGWCSTGAAGQGCASARDCQSGICNGAPGGTCG